MLVEEEAVGAEEKTAEDKAQRAKNRMEYMEHWFWGPILACRRIYGQVIAASFLINLFALAS